MEKKSVQKTYFPHLRASSTRFVSQAAQVSREEGCCSIALKLSSREVTVAREHPHTHDAWKKKNNKLPNFTHRSNICFPRDKRLSA